VASIDFYKLVSLPFVSVITIIVVIIIIIIIVLIVLFTIITSAKEVMFLSLFVCLAVCLLASLRKNFGMGLHEICMEGWQWANEQMVKFWW